ncbi:uncharacterized protein LOC124638215 [Helicoverpa zea]|uniref:uncharacterized protein LOC124638215 n=1 Tax=Helicoverpa zea TaxID=7113 RepID=UPI001F59F126|nr:uncharacterized protein LOC124638215 [Helicoverpa zea]
MLPKKCTHIRIRDYNDYTTDVEKLIKSIEDEYKIDFRSLPDWKHLVKRLHVAKTDCKQKLRDARLRKSMIIDKLYIQATRPSPFELSSGLCRTASKWRKIEMELKKPKQPPIPLLDLMALTAAKELPETPHQNTEIFSSEFSTSAESIVSVPSKVNVEVQVESPVEPPRLPICISTNAHKLFPSPGSKFSRISFRSIFSETGGSVVSDSDKEEWQRLKPTKRVVCTPTPIVLKDNSLKKQSVQFTVTNCTGEFMHIRFEKVIDDSHFLKTKILPVIPKRVYPGISVVYKLIFTLKTPDEFESGLYFKVGPDVYDGAAPEAFCIPIVSAFTISRCAIMPESITFPSVYPWHFKRNDLYTTTNIEIAINDPYTYHLHIYKRVVDLARASNLILSMEPSGPRTESVRERKADKDIDTLASSSKVENNIDSLTVQEAMAFIANGIIELALDTFMFESTYLYLGPYEKTKIPVYFTKIECIGYHQNYYEFEFIDPETEIVKIRKTLKVYAEILAHPITIHPVILDMSKSPVSHGYCEDNFVVSNNHKLYPVTVKIKLTTKMKKMFYVEPMEAIIPESSCVPFAVKFCSRDFLSPKPSEDLVHFTFKVIVLGYKAVYDNVPPFFYEVIAPCAVEFKRVYNSKYFQDTE